jgi:GNAT superfamily N-acetyltransferase
VTPELRQPTASDFCLIADSWQKCFRGMSRDQRHGTSHMSLVEPRTYFREQAKVIDAILGHPETSVLVACWEDLIVGWVCGAPERRLLHFVYVNHLYRREGNASLLMRAMFDELGKKTVTVTHWTRVLPHYRLRWKLEYNPFELYGVVK